MGRNHPRIPEVQGDATSRRQSWPALPSINLLFALDLSIVPTCGRFSPSTFPGSQPTPIGGPPGLSNASYQSHDIATIIVAVSINESFIYLAIAFFIVFICLSVQIPFPDHTFPPQHYSILPGAQRKLSTHFSFKKCQQPAEKRITKFTFDSYP